jgi:hypothetical protein
VSAGPAVTGAAQGPFFGASTHGAAGQSSARNLFGGAGNSSLRVCLGSHRAFCRMAWQRHAHGCPLECTCYYWATCCWCTGQLARGWGQQLEPGVHIRIVRPDTLSLQSHVMPLHWVFVDVPLVESRAASGPFAGHRCSKARLWSPSRTHIIPAEQRHSRMWSRQLWSWAASFNSWLTWCAVTLNHFSRPPWVVPLSMAIHGSCCCEWPWTIL